MHSLAQILFLAAILSLLYGFLVGLVGVAGRLVFGSRRRSRKPVPATEAETRARPPAETAAGRTNASPPPGYIDANFAGGDRDTITGTRFEIGDPVSQCADCYAVYSAFGRTLIGENNGGRCARCGGGRFWQTRYLEPFAGQPGRATADRGSAEAEGPLARRHADPRDDGQARHANRGRAASRRSKAEAGRKRRRARIVLTAALVVLVGAAGSALYLNRGTPSLADIREIVGHPTVEVRQVDGELEFGEQVYPVPVQISDVPEFLKLAIVEIEDRRFYYHLGIDPVGILSGFASYASGRISGRPARLRGGSTITQQVVKNLFLTSDWSYLRKARESWLALKLSLVLTKEEVLELYLNRIFMGGANYGVELAARDYFGVRAKGLNDYQIAMLAGIISRPNRANPRRDTKAAHERARIVLATLERRGRISAGGRDALMKRWHGAPFSALQTGTRSVPRIDRGWIEDWVRREVAAADLVTNEPVRLVLSIDPLAQVYAQLAARRLAEHGREEGGYDSLAVVVLAPDGGIRALVGGANRRANQFNNAILARRPMASTFKPIVYLAALRRGLAPQSIINDEPIMVEGRPYPRNFDDSYRGEVTLADALRMSLNAAAVSLCDTPQERRGVVDLARRLGLKGPFADTPSLALGFVAAAPVEVASVYATLANGGYPVEPWAVAAAQGLNGRVTYQRSPAARRGSIVASRHVAALNRMLNGAATRGTGQAGAFSRNVSGKTGTSQDSRDAWFAGYTGDLVAVIWVGNRGNRRTNGVTGGAMPASAFGNLMANIYDGRIPAAPPGVR